MVISLFCHTCKVCVEGFVISLSSNKNTIWRKMRWFCSYYHFYSCGICWIPNNEGVKLMSAKHKVAIKCWSSGQKLISDNKQLSQQEFLATLILSNKRWFIQSSSICVCLAYKHQGSASLSNLITHHRLKSVCWAPSVHLLAALPCLMIRLKVWNPSI